MVVRLGEYDKSIDNETSHADIHVVRQKIHPKFDYYKNDISLRA